MKLSTRRKRAYSSALRSSSAEETRARILNAAQHLFGKLGIDKVTIAAISAKAGLASSTVYSIFKSKEGILRALMEQSLFGSSFKSAQSLLEGTTDPVRLIELTAHIARAIYESESTDLGLMRNISGFSPSLRKIESEFERIRLEMQKERVEALYVEGKMKPGLDIESARQILWMYTSRDIYRLLVHDSGWSPERYQRWLSETLLSALVG